MLPNWSLFLYRTDASCAFTIISKEHSSWIPLALRCFCQLNLKRSTSADTEKLLWKSPEKGGHCCFAMSLELHLFTGQLTGTKHNQAFICIVWSGQRRKREEKPQTRTPGSLAFSQVSGLDSCRFSKWLFLCHLACPSHLLCLVAFSVLYLLIPTLRSRSPLP